MADGEDDRGPAPEYNVGYGKPPREHQFKVGEPSRNPRGRPPKARHHPIAERQAFLDFFRAIERPVAVQQGRRTVTKPAISAINDQLVAKALKGESWAIRRVMDTRLRLTRDYEATLERMAEKMNELEAYALKAGPLPPEVRAVLDEWRRRLDRPGDELFDMA